MAIDGFMISMPGDYKELPVNCKASPLVCFVSKVDRFQGGLIGQ